MGSGWKKNIYLKINSHRCHILLILKNVSLCYYLRIEKICISLCVIFYLNFLMKIYWLPWTRRMYTHSTLLTTGLYFFGGNFCLQSTITYSSSSLGCTPISVFFFINIFDWRHWIINRTFRMSDALKLAYYCDQQSAFFFLRNR